MILTSASHEETVDALFDGLIIDRFIRKPFRYAQLVSLVQDELTA